MLMNRLVKHGAHLQVCILQNMISSRFARQCAIPFSDCSNNYKAVFISKINNNVRLVILLNQFVARKLLFIYPKLNLQLRNLQGRGLADDISEIEIIYLILHLAPSLPFSLSL